MKVSWWRLLALFAVASADTVVGGIFHCWAALVLGCFAGGAALAAMLESL